MSLRIVSTYRESGREKQQKKGNFPAFAKTVNSLRERWACGGKRNKKNLKKLDRGQEASKKGGEEKGEILNQARRGEL